MIVLYHTNGVIDTIIAEDGVTIDSITGSMTTALFDVALAYPSSSIVWYETRFKGALDHLKLTTILENKNVMVSASQRSSSYLDSAIHYIEESPFMKIHRNVPYPTWLMSTDAGGVQAQVINTLRKEDFEGEEAGYVLNAIAKSFQSQGLFCYQAPLWTDTIQKLDSDDTYKGNTYSLYRFVKQHYKFQWVFFLFICQAYFEKKWPVGALLSSFFVSKKEYVYQAPLVTETVHNTIPSIDVIIPTMGRASYLLDVLHDLSKQTHLPQKVIIVEQNADIDSISELDFLTEESWPFQIIHKFIHQTGACNARNIALSHTTADWVFFADDDIRFEAGLLQKGLNAIQELGVQCIAMSCLQKGEQQTFTKIIQWSSFPSGAAIVSGTLSRKLNFNTAYEHGYGEDTDYGMQLRNEGADVIYHPEVALVHLKAPVGGFRKIVVKEWEKREEKPKPSPTVMLYRLTHTTKKQLQGYKLRLFLRQLKRVPLVQKLSYRKVFKQQWNTSVKWANYLREQ